MANLHADNATRIDLDNVTPNKSAHNTYVPEWIDLTYLTTLPSKHSTYVQPAKGSYMPNKELLHELWRCRECNEPSNRLATMFQRMIVGAQQRLYYKHAAAQEDCAAHALVICLGAWQKFRIDEEINAFAYFWRVIQNGLAYSWNKFESRPIHIPIDKFINNDENG